MAGIRPISQLHRALGLCACLLMAQGGEGPASNVEHHLCMEQVVIIESRACCNHQCLPELDRDQGEMRENLLVPGFRSTTKCLNDSWSYIKTQETLCPFNFSTYRDIHGHEEERKVYKGRADQEDQSLALVACPVLPEGPAPPLPCTSLEGRKFGNDG